MPKFVPDATNVAYSFNRWLCQFKLELPLMTAMAGKTTGHNPVVFDDRLKLLSLYSAVGSEGMTALEATGYDTNDDTNAYSDVLRRLIRIYDRVMRLPILASNALFLPNRMLVKMG